jgi:hypothetical protein
MINMSNIKLYLAFVIVLILGIIFSLIDFLSPLGALLIPVSLAGFYFTYEYKTLTPEQRARRREKEEAGLERRRQEREHLDMVRREEEAREKGRLRAKDEHEEDEEEQRRMKRFRKEFFD